MSQTFKAAPALRGALDRKGAAHYANVSTRTLDEWARQGLLPRLKAGRKTLFRVADLDAFLATLVVDAGKGADNA